MEKWIHRFNRFYDGLITAFFLADVLCVILQVIARFILKMSIPFTEELGRFLLMAFGLLGLATCARRGEHLGAYFLRDSNKTIQIILFFFNVLVGIVMTVIFSYAGIKMIQLSGPKTASTMPIIKWSYIYACFFIGILLSAVYSIRDFLNLLLIVQGKKAIARDLSTPTKEE